MDLYEYQARDLFEKHGVPVLRGIVAETPEQASEAAAKLGTPVVAVKAQVKVCLLYTSPSPRDVEESRMPSSA